MYYLIGFVVSVSLFVLAALFAILLALRPYKQKSIFKSFYVFTCGVFAAAAALFYPLNYPAFADSSFQALTTFFASIHTSIRLFVVDCDLGLILDQAEQLGSVLRNMYLVYSSILFVICPVLTAGAVLSFVANISAYNKYLFSYWRDTYIFSALNERSVALARSFKKNNKKCRIVFTDVFKNETEQSFELVESAKELDAILFKKDITVVKFKTHSKKRKLYFFIIGENDVENIKQIATLSAPPHSRKKVKAEGESKSARVFPKRDGGYDYENRDIRIFLFTVNFSSEQLLSSITPKHIKIRRVNDVQSLIYNLLYNKGMEIFNSAKETGETVFNRATGQNDPQKKISAIILGLGLHGTEMLKALSWFCQMHPYSLEINAFDLDKKADQKFMSSYPDLFDINPVTKIATEKKDPDRKYHNGDFSTPGEAHYQINIYPGQDASLYDFDKKLQALTDTTYVFVALGDDDLNIKVATKVRILLKRLGCEPVIHTVIYNPAKQNTGTKYNVFTFGDINSSYTEECLLHSELEKAALERHMKYANKVVSSSNMPESEKQALLSAEEESFWKVDYNYRSSVASALHSLFKKELDIPGARKAPADRTEDEKWFYRIMEHQRWNAYVRSEGYVWAPVRDKLAKTHHLLVPFDELDPSEQILDDD